MEPTPRQQAALHQLAAVPGVVGSMVFDPAGGLVANEFPAVFDPAGLQHLAAQLAADGYFREWLALDQSGLDLHYVDGHVTVRSLEKNWLLVLCTNLANPQLLSMSLTQVVRRLRPQPGDAPALRTGEPVRPAAPAPPPSSLERLRAIARDELGANAPQALEILATAGATPAALARAVADVEKLTRLFIDKKKAEAIGRRMRDALDASPPKRNAEERG
jgi:predicted regulator of Ras-like GTPase activity (Roadblock/LC7/MglB family)